MTIFGKPKENNSTHPIIVNTTEEDKNLSVYVLIPNACVIFVNGSMYNYNSVNYVIRRQLEDCVLAETPNQVARNGLMKILLALNGEGNNKYRVRSLINLAIAYTYQGKLKLGGGGLKSLTTYELYCIKNLVSGYLKDINLFKAHNLECFKNRWYNNLTFVKNEQTH